MLQDISNQIAQDRDLIPYSLFEIPVTRKLMLTVPWGAINEAQHSLNCCPKQHPSAYRSLKFVA